MTDERSGTLGITHLPVEKTELPKRVWWDDELLHYETFNSLVEESYVPKSTDGMLDRFTRIDSARDAAEFAQWFGPLDLCTHGLPWRHTFESDEGFSDLWNPERTSCEPMSAERFSDWFKWVACARSILAVAVALHDGRLPAIEDWDPIVLAISPIDKDFSREEYLTREGIDAAKLLLGDLLWSWLRMADVRPKFSWDPHPELYLKAGTFGELGIQLMRAVSQGHGLVTCSGCGVPYMRKGRKPQAGRRNYCPDCGQRAALRDAQRARRAKERGIGEEG
jgi:hypothetical protein